MRIFREIYASAAEVAFQRSQVEARVAASYQKQHHELSRSEALRLAAKHTAGPVGPYVGVPQ